ncbi:helix-turn-helix transcriptional regulator [Avrilella dinanensis]|uniref:helix-turn-helix transcriptional regulator n=1 Tax=Avrilella dinanensis TaxID=2008672 RepID=UPI002408F852|nr:helix-turn-helix transcriptional regulator [Avrilella dinanensis]
MKTKIKVFRAIHDMTQAELAEKLGVTRQTINAIEAGKYAPSVELALKMSKLFDVTVNEIFQLD